MKKIVAVLLLLAAALPATAFNFNAALSLYAGPSFERGDILRTSGNLLHKGRNHRRWRGQGDLSISIAPTLEGKGAYLIGAVLPSGSI